MKALVLWLRALPREGWRAIGYLAIGFPAAIGGLAAEVVWMTQPVRTFSVAALVGGAAFIVGCLSVFGAIIAALEWERGRS